VAAKNQELEEAKKSTLLTKLDTQEAKVEDLKKRQA
jgi:hypothetical protein